MAKQIIVTKDNYGIEIIATLVNQNKENVDVTGQIVEVVIVDDNDTIIDKVEAQHINSSKGIVSITLQKEHTSTIGLYKTYWSALDKNNNVTAQEDIYYYCKDKNGGASNDSYVQEEKLDNESIIDKFKETDAEIEGIKKDISHLYKVSANAELADARGEYGTLGERLDDVDNDLTGVHLEIENINASFDNCATKNELSNYALSDHMHTTDNINGITAYATKKYVDIKYDELFQSVSNGKGLLASAITDMGVTTLATDTFEVMANNIRKITTGGGDTGGGDTQPSPSYDIIPSQSSYTIKAGQDLLVNFTSSINISTCMLLFAPDYSNDYVGGYISSAGVFTFYTSSRSTGTYSVKIKGRKFNDSTQTYDDYYSDVFTLTIEDNTSGGEGGGGSEQPTTPITINKINDMTVKSGSVFNIVYTTNVDAVNHEMSFDGGSTFHIIYPSGNKNGYTYEHEALTETAYPHQRKIRVRDANGNVATSNTFNINVSTNGGGGGSTKSPFLASMYGDPRVIPNYPSGIQFPPINAHEDGIQPNGVNTSDSWKYGTRINQSPRSDWTRIGFWGQVYRQEGYGYDPDNVAVEIKDCKLWGWNGSSWVLIHDVSFSSSNTSFYVESFAGDSNKTFPSNLKLNGKNVTVKFDSVNSGYMFHPYSGKARANDYGLPKPYYYCSTMSARLVKWDSSGADNLDSAKLCFNVGGDFWHTTHETWQPDWSANGEYAQGQFLKCTREWKTAYCTNVPESWGNGFPSL